MYYINISNGLLKDSHRTRMGEAIWEFMWLLDRMTSESEDGIGKVLGGRPIKIDEIACGFPVHRTTVIRNLKRLENEGYINVIRAPYGLVITVNKAKKKLVRDVASLHRDIADTQHLIRYSKDATSNNTKHYLTKTKQSARPAGVDVKPLEGVRGGGLRHI
ncbi:MAG: hypothetical protein M1361_01145 [Patescibacteria group bacterium]|nr:hypothetical protein [Patescibacteria group bacterium]MCL5224209.1 hypothetical protein [Patescibacteria group bacterium]